MKKILELNRLLVYIVLFFFVKSQDNNSSLCLTDGFLPGNATECNRHSTDEYYCCYLTPIESSNTSLCYKYEVFKYKGQGSINYKQNSYLIYCGLGTKVATLGVQGSLGSPCGIKNPTSSKDCNGASSLDNSCCFYSYEGLNGCYWLGAKYFGTTYHKELTMTCISTNIHTYFIMFILYYLIFVV